MPSPTPVLKPDDVRRHVEESCLTLSQARRVGVEREWFTVRPDAPDAHVDFDLVRGIVDATDLPGNSRITYEPGGQLELSSPPEPDATLACSVLSTDEAVLREALGARGIELLAVGMDPTRHLRRVIDAPRYRAMEHFFDSRSAAGRRMMRGTAAIQINLEAGSHDDADRRWKRAHALGPTLGAAFANSSMAGGAPNGWRSGRLATWWAIDATRTWPAVSDLPAIDAWERYVLSARVMMIRRSESDFIPIINPLTFEAWMLDGHAAGYPTEDDLAYHITTLFPPVRLKGWLELRFIDALPEPWWHVAVAVTTALLDDDDAAARAELACAPAADLWHQAALHGLDHPVLGPAAIGCFEAALESMDRSNAPSEARDATAAYFDRYVARGRTPADDAIDAARNGDATPVKVKEAELAWT